MTSAEKTIARVKTFYEKETAVLANATPFEKFDDRLFQFWFCEMRKADARAAESARGGGVYMGEGQD